ncbi:MAG TPA: hypothetical protein VGG28_23820 [Kofleriaceae bacterium]|jgi:hypothetical protein
MSVRSVFSKLGTALIVLGVLGAGALVAWHEWGQASYRGDCEHAISCQSFYCIHHAAHGSDQIATAHGRCTRSCDADGDCGSGAVCAVLGAAASDDLPPIGKPERACLLVQ